MHSQRGFLSYDASRDRYAINWRETLSIVVGELLLEELLAARSHIKGRLLDVGCGTRPYSLIYEPLVDMSVGTEVAFSPHGIEAADVICCAEALPFISNSFDTILCTEVLEHTRQPFQVMQEFARLLHPGGYLLLSVPFIYPVHESPHDYWRFTAHGLEAICESAGLTLIYVHSKGGIVATLVSLWIHLTVRCVNALSKLLGLSKPLREERAVRWFLAVPQWGYLWLSRLSRTRINLAWVSKLEWWMSPGYVVLAQRPMRR